VVEIAGAVEIKKVIYLKMFHYSEWNVRTWKRLLGWNSVSQKGSAVINLTKEPEERIQKRNDLNERRSYR